MKSQAITMFNTIFKKTFKYLSFTMATNGMTVFYTTVFYILLFSIQVIEKQLFMYKCYQKVENMKI